MAAKKIFAVLVVFVLILAVVFYVATPPSGVSPVGTSANVPSWHEGTTTWSDAQQKCQAMGKNLCSYDTLCPSGAGSAPVGANYSGDNWVPVSDSVNEWVQASDSRKCKLHGPPGIGPGWGKDPTPTSWKGKFSCCS